MKKYFIYFIFLACGFYANQAMAQPAMDWKTDPRFKTGTLKDFTPPQISPNAVTVCAGEPVFLVVGVERGVDIDIRPDSERDKIHFKLLSGKGEFANMEALSVKQSGELTGTANFSGVVAVLFYPQGAGVYQIAADCPANPAFGQVAFNFAEGTLDKAGFLSAAHKGIDADQKWEFGDAEVIQTISTTSYNPSKKVMDAPRVTTEYEKYHADHLEARDKDASGKVLRTALLDEAKLKANSDISVYTDFWAVDGKNEIFLDKHEAPKEKTCYIFFFIDKEEGIINGTSSLSPIGFGVDEHQYVKKGGVNFPVMQEMRNSSYQGKQTSDMKVEYQILSPK